MTIKKPHTIKTLKQDELTQVNQNWDGLYALKLESRFKRMSSGVTSYIYQSMESGEGWFSANGSAVTTITYALEERQSTIITAFAQSRNSTITAQVTDVTQTAVTIQCYPRLIWDQLISTSLALLSFSQATTASVSVYYFVIGSNP